MSDLAATNCGCGCDERCGGCGNNTGLWGGNGCNSIIWIILLLCMCNGNGSGCGCGDSCGNDNSCWIIILLLFCCGGNSFCG